MKTKIYHLLDECGNIRNVGKTFRTLEARLKGHLKEARSGKQNHRCNWIRSMVARGLTPTIELQTEVSGDGCGAEIAYIAYYRKKGFDLVNGTDGGEGCSGTPEVRLKISQSRKGQRLSEACKRKISLANKGRKLSDETRKKMSLAWKGHVVSKETRKKISDHHKKHPNRCWLGRHHTQQSKIKMSTARMGIKYSEETRKRMSIAHKGKRWTIAQRQAHQKGTNNEK